MNLSKEEVRKRSKCYLDSFYYIAKKLGENHPVTSMMGALAWRRGEYEGAAHHNIKGTVAQMAWLEGCFHILNIWARDNDPVAQSIMLDLWNGRKKPEELVYEEKEKILSQPNCKFTSKDIYAVQEDPEYPEFCFLVKSQRTGRFFTLENAIIDLPDFDIFVQVPERDEYGDLPDEDQDILLSLIPKKYLYSTMESTFSVNIEGKEEVGPAIKYLESFGITVLSSEEFQKIRYKGN